jgi:hypothetical protein
MAGLCAILDLNSTMLAIADIAAVLSGNPGKKKLDDWVMLMAKEGFEWDEYWQVLEQTPLPNKWYLTWLLSHYIDAYPHMDEVNQQRLWKLLLSCQHVGMLRDLWRVLSCINVDESISGAVYDKALLVSLTPVIALATRVNALETAYRIALPYPELLEEIQRLLLSMPEEEEAAPSLQARKRQVLGKIKKALRSFNQ